MKRVVISQPFYIPWYGLFEQVLLADYFIHYDDVQLPQGRSFCSRVQIKTNNGIKWLTVPLRKKGLPKQLICDVKIDNSGKWKKTHRETIVSSYSRADYGRDAIMLADEIINFETDSIAELDIFGIELIADYLGIKTVFIKSSELITTTKSSARIIETIRGVVQEPVEYITGMGAKNYLKHVELEENRIYTKYMKYTEIRYKQLYGDFTPYVTILDLIAIHGRQSKELLQPELNKWRDVSYE